MIETYENMSIMELRDLLKNEIIKTNIKDLYELSYHFNDEVKYLPREYKKQYKESVLKVIINRFNNLKNDNNNYKGNITKRQSEEIKNLSSKYEDKISYILKIIVIYATYVLHEPVHLSGTVFPGRISIYDDGENYYCPIKKYHVNNNKAICKYCIAKECL